MEKKLTDVKALTLVYLLCGQKKVDMIRVLASTLKGLKIEYRFSTSNMSPMFIYEHCKSSQFRATYLDGYIYETKTLSEDEHRHLQTCKVEGTYIYNIDPANYPFDS
jgi:hypothetical protein